MPGTVELKSSEELGSETRPVFGLAENRVRVPELGKKKEELKKRLTKPVLRRNSSVDSLSYSDSSKSNSVKKRNFRRNGMKNAKIVPDGVKVPSSLSSTVEMKRCDWITSNSDPLYASFHDEEWGVPVHDDRKLFELLVLSEALAELSWPGILSQRDMFRKCFDNFDPTSVAKFTEKDILTLKASGKALLSEPKIRAVVENAKQILKVQQEFGSFNNYCWSFVNHKPLRNGYRYVRQVPVKTPKAETISKDLMRRGFRCVGPTVVYSFMQVAGIVNDHLLTCFRFQECDSNMKKDIEAKIEATKLARPMEKTCLSPA